MMHPASVDTLPLAAQKALAGAGPMRMMVARGLAPLAPVALVSALYALSYDADAALATAARTSLEKLPGPLLDGALSNAELSPAVIDDLADRFKARPGFLAGVVQHAATLPETIERIASQADEDLCERIAVNEERLLQHPRIIEALYMNRALRMSTADRMIEFAARNGVDLSIPGFKEIAASLKDQLIPEAGGTTPADELFHAALIAGDEADAADEDVVDANEDGDETLKEKFKKVEKTLQEMTVSEKVRVAMLGSPSQRMLLVRSSNRLVAMAAVSSPRAQDNEAVQISASRQVGEDILRFVANKREWVRLHQVKTNLCFNPKTPVSTSLRLLPHMREADLKTLSRSKNVSQTLKSAVAQLLTKRTQK